MRNALYLVLIILGFSLFATAQGNDLAVVAGAKITPSASSAVGTTSVNTALGFEGSFAIQIKSLPFAALQLEVPVMVTPNTTLTSPNLLASKSYNSIYFTPGARLTFRAGLPVNPWVAVGGGIVRFAPSSFSRAGTFSPAAGALKGAVDAGGGLDFKAPHFPVTLRVEVREYFSGAPNLNIPNLSLHNNIFAGIGLVVKF